MFIKLLSILCLYKYVSSAINGPVVELPTGKILGRAATTFANTSYFSFEKIPYARPPIGELRFKAPQPVQNWDNILDATAPGSTCFQLDRFLETDSEDCLFLNVYTPELPGNGTLPVMLYIHGGGFMQGSGTDYAPDLFLDNGVILVTFNYRLGVLGFLSTQDEIIPGNNGLKDQKLAIEWTHDNILLFGGDAEKITVFGESAGSASVAYQLLNQDSKGLFRAVILQSGVSICPWSYQRDARNIAFGLGAVLDPNFETSDDSEALLELLQSVSAEDLDSASEQYFADISTPWDNDVSQGVKFGPVIEVKNPDAFITRRMFGLFRAGNFLKVPILMGMTSEELLFFNQDPAGLQSLLEAWDEDLDLIVPNDMRITDPDHHTEMAHHIRNIYTNGTAFGDNLAAGLRFSSDTSFTRPVLKFAELVSRSTETYFYQFSYDGELGGIDIHYDGAESVGHSEELHYMFCSGTECDFSKYSESDRVTKERMVQMWTDFAKYLDPTPEPSSLLQNISWPRLPYDNSDFLYLDINENLVLRRNPKNEVYQKWIGLYDSLEIIDFDTF